MKKTHFLLFVLTITALLLSACGAEAATPSTGGGGKVDAIPVAFIGRVESIAGDQWVINGNTVTVDPTVVRDGPFNVGDQVKVEGVVNADGSIDVSRVETPTATDLSTLPQFGNDNSNANTNDANVNDGNINADNSNAVNSNDDNSNAANANDANINDDNGNETNLNDDNGNTANVNDDNGNSANSNDDNGGAVNDNHGNNDNSGGGSGNGVDDNGGGDDSGGGGNGNGD